MKEIVNVTIFTDVIVSNDVIADCVIYVDVVEVAVHVVPQHLLDSLSTDVQRVQIPHL